MNAINLAGTDDTPNVILDKDANVYSLSGRSLPEDVVSFYNPILAWLDEYAGSPAAEMNFELKLEYFNTASSKMILDVLMKLEEIADNGANIKIKWHFDGSDDDMKEAGEEYSELVSVPFEMIEY